MRYKKLSVVIFLFVLSLGTLPIPTLYAENLFTPKKEQNEEKFDLLKKIRVEAEKRKVAPINASNSGL
jgi:hypothetical protein